MTENTNPLGKYYRQPQIYIKLPSGGRYYPKEVYTPTETGEIPILPMTAKDEMAFKTPDAMINGQSTVDVIKSCVPNLLDPWKMVNLRHRCGTAGNQDSNIWRDHGCVLHHPGTRRKSNVNC